MSEPAKTPVYRPALTPEQMHEVLNALSEFSEHLEETEQTPGRVEILNAIEEHLRSTELSAE